MPTRRSATACDALALPRRRRAFGSAASRRALCLLFATVTLASVSGAGIEDLLGQMMGGQGGFQQMGGMGGMGGGRRRQREVVEEPEYELDVDEEYEWLAGTTWNWNNWKNVKFEASGKFDAPDKPCEEGRCTWSARKGKIKILKRTRWLEEAYFLVPMSRETDSQLAIVTPSRETFHVNNDSIIIEHDKSTLYTASIL